MRPTHHIQQIPAVIKDIFDCIVAPRLSVNYFNSSPFINVRSLTYSYDCLPYVTWRHTCVLKTCVLVSKLVFKVLILNILVLDSVLVNVSVNEDVVEIKPCLPVFVVCWLLNHWMLTSYILIKRPTFSWLHMIFLNQSIKCGDSRLVIFQQCSSQVGCRRDISLLQTVRVCQT